MKKSYLGILIFTLGYLIIFTPKFLARGNSEFIAYTAVVIVLGVFIAFLIRRYEIPALVLWGLSVWGFLHLAGGGGITINGHGLYSLHLINIANAGGDLVILKYDQFVHAFGFFVTTFLLFYMMKPYVFSYKGFTIPLTAALGSMGLGAFNEIMEFMAVLALPQTGVGGYENTLLDLVFNTLGASIAALLLFYIHQRSSQAIK